MRDGAAVMTHANGRINVGDVERVASAVAGAALFKRGLKRRSLGGLVLAAAGGSLLYRGFSGHCGLYQRLGRDTAHNDPTAVTRAITIGKPADELYRMWCDPQILSRIMGHFAEVRSIGDKRLHWSAHGPLDRSFEWDAEIVDDHPDESLAWRSLAGADLPNEGRVQFTPAPQERGTEVTLFMRFDPPGGALGKAAAQVLGSAPGLLASHVLRRFKSLAETGEIATTRHNPSGRVSAV